MKIATKISGSATKGGIIFQYLAMCTGTLNMLCTGMQYGWPSPSLPKLLHGENHIPITNDQGSWIAVMIMFGGACGSLSASVLVNNFGRKNIILFTSIPFIISWMLLAFAQSVALLMVGRFLGGISDGLMFCSIPMYLAEISDPRIRGVLGSGITVTQILGMMLVNVIGSQLSVTATALICSAVPVLLLLTFSWMPESPYYLIMKGRYEQARHSLRVFKGTQDVERELNRLIEAVAEQNRNTGKYLDLFTDKGNRRALYVVLGTRAFQQWSGITAYAFYTQTIFKEAGLAISPSTSSVIYFAMQIIFSICCTAIVDRAGRRPLMIISMMGSCVALLAEGCFFYIKEKTDVNTDGLSLVPIIVLFVFVIVFNIGMQTIPLLLIGEMFPTNVKAFALSFSDVYFCILTAIVSKFFQSTKDGFGLHVPFLVFSGCCALGLMFIIYVVPETKGKTLEEIQQELKGATQESKPPELAEERYVL